MKIYLFLFTLWNASAVQGWALIHPSNRQRTTTPGMSIISTSLYSTASVQALNGGDIVILTRRGSAAVAEATMATSTTQSRSFKRARSRLTSSRSATNSKRNNNFYVTFAQNYPFLNNILMATFKAGSADLLAQTVLSGTPLRHFDVPRSVLFMLFGAIYSGIFQWFYQVRVFSKIFGKTISSFTEQGWREKLRDRAGLISLMQQTALDLLVLTFAYFPAFYIFQAGVLGAAGGTVQAQSSSLLPLGWASTAVMQGWAHFKANLAQDFLDVIRVWLPADLLCFSVPMYLRLPVRHAVAFAWTAYLSLARGGH